MQVTLGYPYHAFEFFIYLLFQGHLFKFDGCSWALIGDNSVVIFSNFSSFVCCYVVKCEDFSVDSCFSAVTYWDVAVFVVGSFKSLVL